MIPNAVVNWSCNSALRTAQCILQALYMYIGVCTKFALLLNVPIYVWVIVTRMGRGYMEGVTSR